MRIVGAKDLDPDFVPICPNCRKFLGFADYSSS